MWCVCTWRLWKVVSLHLACYGCLTDDNDVDRVRRDRLVTPVTAVLGNLAAHFATLVLVGQRDRDLRDHNVFIFDLERLEMEQLAVARRDSCQICGRKDAAS